MNRRHLHRRLARYLPFALLAAFIALTSASVTAQNVYTTADGHPFQVSISCPDSGLLSGEDTSLDLEVRNLSSERLILSAFSPGSPNSTLFRIQVRNDTSHRLTIEQGLNKEAAEIQIPPGECFRTQVPLWIGYFQITGRHVILLETGLRIGASDPTSKPPIPIAATTEIEISPSNSETRGDVMAQLGETLINGKQPAATRAAVRLNELKDPRVLSVFFRFLDVCDARTTAEGKLPSDLELIIRLMTWTVVRDYQDIFPEGGQVAEFLQRLKNSPSVFIRKTFASELASLRNFGCFDLPGHHPERRNLLLEMNRDPNPDIRAFVAKEIGELYDPKAEQVLGEMLEDRDETVRLAAQRSLDARKASNPK